MNIYKTMIIASILIVLGMLSYVLTHTYFHEIGHVFLIRLYKKKTKVGVVLNKRISMKWGLHKKRIFLKNFNFKVYTDKLIKGVTKQAGLTLTEENYLEFEVRLLKTIAKGGVIAQSIYGELLGLLLGGICKLVTSMNLIAIYTFGAVLITPLLDTIYTLVKKVDKSSNKWPDKRIWKDSIGFYNFIRSEKAEGTPKYQDYFE